MCGVEEKAYYVRGVEEKALKVREPARRIVRRGAVVHDFRSSADKRTGVMSRGFSSFYINRSATGIGAIDGCGRSSRVGSFDEGDRADASATGR